MNVRHSDQRATLCHTNPHLVFAATKRRVLNGSTSSIGLSSRELSSLMPFVEMSENVRIEVLGSSVGFDDPIGGGADTEWSQVIQTEIRKVVRRLPYYTTRSAEQILCCDRWPQAGSSACESQMGVSLTRN